MYVSLFIAFLILFRQLLYQKFHTTIFAKNLSQIYVFSEDLIKYIWSLKYCSSTFEKRDKNYKTKKKYLIQILFLLFQIDFWVEIRVRVPNFYKKDSFTFLLLHYV